MKTKKKYTNIETRKLVLQISADPHIKCLFIAMAKRSLDNQDFARQVKSWLEGLHRLTIAYRDPYGIKVLLDIGSRHRIKWREIADLCDELK